MGLRLEKHLNPQRKQGGKIRERSDSYETQRMEIRS